MRLRLSHFLLIAAPMICACTTSPQPSKPQTTPPLEASLAAPCEAISEPPAGSYDLWQDWVQSVVLKAYGVCAARHIAVVNAWPK